MTSCVHEMFVHLPHAMSSEKCHPVVIVSYGKCFLLSGCFQESVPESVLCFHDIVGKVSENLFAWCCWKLSWKVLQLSARCEGRNIPLDSSLT